MTTPAHPYGLNPHPLVEHEAKKAQAEKELLSRLDGVAVGRQSLIDALWATLPAQITEWDYTTDTKVLNVPPVTTEIVRVRSIVVFCGTDTGGVLTLGTVTFPVPGSPSRFTNWRGLNILVTQSQPRRLRVGTASALGLILCGEMVPQHGHF